MNPKKLKKLAKRQTAKKRAQRQTTRRRKQQETDRFKDQVAQDIYASLQAPNPKGGRKRAAGEYRLMEYDYNMFNYGDPVKVAGRTLLPVHMNRRQGSGRSPPKRENRATPRKEQKRLRMWRRNIESLREAKKKTSRAARKQRKKDAAKRVRRPTSRKIKKS